MYTVYLLTNTVNLKKYVGITSTTVESRFNTHFAFASRKKSSMYSDMLLYGRDLFCIKALEDNIPDYQQACKREHYYIIKYDTYSNGYNNNLGSTGVVSHSLETKLKISDSLKGHVFPESRNEKIRNAMIGREYKDEWKRSLSQACKGKRMGENNPFYGKHHTQETICHLRVRHAKRSVCMCNANMDVLHVFASCNEAARWLESNKKCSNSNTANGRIRFICDNNKTGSVAYSYHWKYKEGPSTNCKAEDELPSEAQSPSDKG